jgi:hypothetical protein
MSENIRDLFGSIRPPTPAPDCSATALAISNCKLCDARGYRGNRVCDHVDHYTENARGRAAAQKVLKEIAERTKRPNPPTQHAQDLAARQRAAAPPVPMGADQ